MTAYSVQGVEGLAKVVSTVNGATVVTDALAAIGSAGTVENGAAGLKTFQETTIEYKAGAGKQEYPNASYPVLATVSESGALSIQKTGEAGVQGLQVAVQVKNADGSTAQTQQVGIDQVGTVSGINLEQGQSVVIEVKGPQSQLAGEVRGLLGAMSAIRAQVAKISQLEIRQMKSETTAGKLILWARIKWANWGLSSQVKSFEKAQNDIFHRIAASPDGAALLETAMPLLLTKANTKTGQFSFSSNGVSSSILETLKSFRESSMSPEAYRVIVKNSTLAELAQVSSPQGDIAGFIQTKATTWNVPQWLRTTAKVMVNPFTFYGTAMGLTLLTGTVLKDCFKPERHCERYFTRRA
jgi:hypothetical protein